MGKYYEAIECFNQVIKLDPKYSDVFYAKGISLNHLGKYLEAIECFN
jgi:tetratricopeptide (TPR) repeat protein